MQQRGRLAFALLLLALTATSGALAWSSAAGDSATFDEPAHLVSGLLKLREGRITFYLEQAPLMDAIVALPPALAGYRVPPELQQAAPHPWVAGRALLYRSGYDAHRMLLLARLPVVLLLVALSWTVFFFVRDATGDRFAAIGAAALTAFCPNLLAHGHLATVDLGVTFFLFAAGALYIRLLRVPSAAGAVACGVATACAISSKVSAAVIVVFFALLLVRRPRPWRLLAVAGASSVAAFTAIYLLLARSLDPFLPFRTWLGSASAVRYLYTEGFPIPQFVLGEFSTTGWRGYQLVALAVKSTLPAIVLGLVAAWVTVRRRRYEAVACLVFVLLFVVAAAFSRLSIGVRHVLPVYPFLYAAAGVSLAGRARSLRRAALPAALVVWHVAAGAASWPATISYFNPLIGSSRNADRVLIDSNLDWGQDLRRLGSWAAGQGIASMRVDYFGGGDVRYDTMGRGLPWRRAPGGNTAPGDWLAVSRHNYRLSFMPGAPVDYDRWLRQANARYVTTIGGSMDVYRVD